MLKFRRIFIKIREFFGKNQYPEPSVSRPRSHDVCEERERRKAAEARDNPRQALFEELRRSVKN